MTNMTCKRQFDYLTEGDTYEIYPMSDGGVRVWNVRRQGGTFLSRWQYQDAIARGYLVAA